MTTTTATTTTYGLLTAAAIDAEVDALGIRGCTPRKSRLNEYAFHGCRCTACTKAASLYDAARNRLHSEAATVRAWAATNGHTLGARGPIPAAVLDAYRAAQATS